MIDRPSPRSLFLLAMVTVSCLGLTGCGSTMQLSAADKEAIAKPHVVVLDSSPSGYGAYEYYNPTIRMHYLSYPHQLKSLPDDTKFKHMGGRKRLWTKSELIGRFDRARRFVHRVYTETDDILSPQDVALSLVDSMGLGIRVAGAVPSRVSYISLPDSSGSFSEMLAEASENATDLGVKYLVVIDVFCHMEHVLKGVDFKPAATIALYRLSDMTRIYSKQLTGRSTSLTKSNRQGFQVFREEFDLFAGRILQTIRSDMN